MCEVAPESAHHVKLEAVEGADFSEMVENEEFPAISEMTEELVILEMMENGVGTLEIMFELIGTSLKHDFIWGCSKMWAGGGMDDIL